MEDPDSPDGMFIFGSYWNGIHQFSFKNPPTKFLYAPVEAVITNHTSTAENNDVSAVVEGGTMFKYADFYYLFFSVGKCCNKPPELAKAGDEYRVAVCRSQDVKGPYVDADGKSCKTENGGTTVLASHHDVYSPGGQGVILDEESKRVAMYYHYGMCKRIGAYGNPP
jgi:arabinan endo-1,5-alpha-L-arabinosidase